MKDDKPHLLIVDDEPMNLDLLKRILESKYQISKAENAQEALAILDQGNSIALILSDYFMPGKTGVEFSKIVYEKWPTISFMLITGMECEEVDMAVSKKWVSEILYKPWRKTQLESMVAALLVK